MAYADTLKSLLPTRAKRNSYQYQDTVSNPYFKYSYGKFWPEPVLEVSEETPFRYDPRSNKNR